MKIKKMNKINKNIFWKSISLVFIVLFLLILVVGLFRVYKFKSSFVSATDEEINLAKSIAIDFFNSSIEEKENIRDYNISASKRARFMKEEDKNKIIEVSFKKDSKRISYLVDIDSKKVLIQSTIEFYHNKEHMNDTYKEYKESRERNFKKWKKWKRP